MRKNFFTLRVTEPWPRLPRGAVESPSLGDIQNQPGWGPVQPALGDPALARGLDWVIPRGPFQPRSFCDSVNHSRYLSYKSRNLQSGAEIFLNSSCYLRWCFSAPVDNSMLQNYHLKNHNAVAQPPRWFCFTWMEGSRPLQTTPEIMETEKEVQDIRFSAFPVSSSA